MNRKFLGTILIILCIFFSMGCEIPTERMDADSQQRMATQQALKEAHSQIGMPAIKNFQERKLAKMIFELRDQENLITYAYVVNLQGELIFIGKCIGFGLPYSVQYTNPEKVLYEGGYNCGYGTLPQADPNGLFMPDGLSATWLMMLDNKGKPHPVYVEPQIIVSPFPLH